MIVYCPFISHFNPHMFTFLFLLFWFVLIVLQPDLIVQPPPPPPPQPNLTFNLWPQPQPDVQVTDADLPIPWYRRWYTYMNVNGIPWPCPTMGPVSCPCITAVCNSDCWSSCPCCRKTNNNEEEGKTKIRKICPLHIKLCCYGNLISRRYEGDILRDVNVMKTKWSKWTFQNQLWLKTVIKWQFYLLFCNLLYIKTIEKVNVICST